MRAVIVEDHTYVSREDLRAALRFIVQRHQLDELEVAGLAEPEMLAGDLRLGGPATPIDKPAPKPKRR